jgi:hypothetical protein
MLDLADAGIESDDKVQKLIQAMFDQAGIRDKQQMDFDDFCKIFASSDYGDILQDATLGLNGKNKF